MDEKQGGVPEQPVEAVPASTAASATPELAAPELVTAPAPVDVSQPELAPSVTLAETEPEPITWMASEFIAHQKSTTWYGILFGGAAALAAAVFLITRDIISTIVVVVAAGFMALAAARKPRQLEYKIGGKGILLGQRYYDYTAFRSFATIPEGPFTSIVFMPLRRFSPAVIMYCPPDMVEVIVEHLSMYLPMHDHKLDVVDHVMSRIRF